MKKPARILSALLAVLMLAVCFISCADTTDPQATPTPTVKPTETPDENPTGTPRITPDIPATYDFDDQTVNFLYWNVESWENTVRYCRDITCEEYSGDRVSAAVYDRNAVVEEKYKVKITVDIRKHDTIAGLVTGDNATGDQEFQVVVPRVLEASGMLSNGSFLNFYNVDYINLEQPWWDQDGIEQLASKDVLYMVTSSLLVNDKDATAALAFSKKAATDNSLGDLYALVSNNEWTYETVADLASRATSDTNGDQRMDEEDFWGFLGKNDVMTSFYHGSGYRLAGKNDDEEFVLSIGEEEESIEAAQAVIDFVRNEDWFYNHHATGISDDQYTLLFEEGHGLFFWMRLDEVTNMRNSEVEFGILPIPKFTSDQDNYHSTVSPHTTGMLTIPKSNNGAKLEMTGMILEALSAESHYTLQPAYIEDSLKTRYSRDGESKDMLDIILNSRVFDPACVFGFSKFADDFQNLARNTTTQIASFLETRIDSVNSAIEKFNDNLADLSLLD